MALLRKKHPEWKPAENKALQIGETLEIDNYRGLVESGMAEYVDEAGNVLPLPGTVFVCGICFEQIDSHPAYIDHIMANHNTIAKKPTVESTDDDEEKTSEEFDVKKEFVATAKKSDFGKKMAEARAKKRAEREAQKQ